MKKWILFLLPSLAFADYDRADWKHWIDADSDCQDTRQEILIRDSLIPVELSENGCRVVAGVWQGQYTGEVFTRPKALDIDHIVPLKWAYKHGGENWSPLLRQVFANDPENLLAVKASANRAKGAKGPDEYMPEQNQCMYLQQWRSIVGRYGLSGEIPRCGN
jgi:5-methylcytosine-specific restriction endonuclease McrA